MKKIILSVAYFNILLSSYTCSAQKRYALIGSGKLITQQLNLIPFTKIETEGWGGYLEIDAAAITYSATITADDNLAPLIQTTNQNGILKISIKGNTNNHLWLEENHIKVHISAPGLTALVMEGNGNRVVTGINTPIFTLEKDGNSNISLEGITQKLIIHKSGNGHIDASQLKALDADIKGRGNGDIRFYAPGQVNTSLSGNMGIVNTATGVTKRRH